MSGKKPKIVVTGFIGLLPVGGVTWDYIQYPLGFRELGCEVLYLEDTMQWPVYQQIPENGAGEVSCAANVAYLDSVMTSFGLNDRWAYRDEVSGHLFGMDERRLTDFCRSADLFVNISCSTPLRDEYAVIPVRALIDTDPMFTQVQAVTGCNLYGQRSSIPEMLTSHTHLFTFGENLGQPACQVPTAGKHWHPTRQPVVLEHWPVSSVPPGRYTTVMNLTAAKPFSFDGREWGQKDSEFLKLIGVPSRCGGAKFGVAVGQTTGALFPIDLASDQGWAVYDAHKVSASPSVYREFIQQSHAEFSVAKHTYVQAETGWFSCRSACYLASGRPVVTQDTGWSRLIANGSGLFAFRNEDEAVAAIEAIEREPARHAHAARKIAEQFFDSRRVLTSMLGALGF